MPALPADIAAYTTDGTVIVSPVNAAVSAGIKAAHIDARDLGTTEIEMFFDAPADAQAMLDETFAILSQVNPPYLALELAETLGLGSAIPIAPAVPTFTVTDDPAGFTAALRTRAFSAEMGTDRYAVELVA